LESHGSERQGFNHKAIRYNKYSLRCIKQFEDGQIMPSGTRKFGLVTIPSISAAFGTMNHGVGGSSKSFNYQQYHADCAVATAFHVAAHGQESTLWIDKYPGNNNIADPLPGQEYSGGYFSSWTLQASSIGQKIRDRQPATTMPPVPGFPNVGIAFASACSTMQSPASPSFGKAYIGYPTPLQNKAYGGFDRVSLIAGMQAGAIAFWKKLAEGRTVNDASEFVQSAYKAEYQKWKSDPDFAPNLDGAVFKIYGDANAKLHGLYGKDGLTWYSFE
jgi:hypothetical protein